ncbi:g5694 [Coccomyxa viridis]|uniref:Peptidyl-prolyl cis-trans isomerase n=1 Tax=Coccomyxa viridis TaxID=1274662 RepID=A0ABP1G0C7_9CHLO
MRVFLDIDIGDREAYDREGAAHKVTADYLTSVGSQYGLPDRLEELDGEGRETLQEAFKADPSWSKKAAFTPIAPKNIRAGRLIVELYTEEAPKASENFRCLCTGEKGVGKASKKALHYKGTKFHRIVKGFVCQGGDIVRGDGSGGDSIYGRTFNDEKGALKLKHDGAGVLGMANSGKNTNSSQFFFTLGSAPKCDGKHVVLGKVVDGLHILTQIDEEAASEDGTPRVEVTIAECGQL